jgi:lysozyme
MTDNEILEILIKKAEGFSLKAYLCPAGKWTIGWGQTGPSIKQGTVWTLLQCVKALEDTSNDCLMAAVVVSPRLSRENSAKRAAVADFIYNFDKGRYQRSTLCKYVDAGKWLDANKEIRKWVYGLNHKTGKKEIMPGLVKRRNIEGLLLTMPDNDDPETVLRMYE